MEEFLKSALPHFWVLLLPIGILVLMYGPPQIVRRRATKYLGPLLGSNQAPVFEKGALFVFRGSYKGREVTCRLGGGI